MGRASRAKAERRTGVQLEEVEARRLLAAQVTEAQMQLKVRQAADQINAQLKAAVDAKNAVFDTLAKKYHLDPAVPYALDEETLMLTPQPKATR